MDNKTMLLSKQEEKEYCCKSIYDKNIFELGLL